MQTIKETSSTQHKRLFSQQSLPSADSFQILKENTRNVSLVINHFLRYEVAFWQINSDIKSAKIR
jgi:hypothetical protein